MAPKQEKAAATNISNLIKNFNDLHASFKRVADDVLDEVKRCEEEQYLLPQAEQDRLLARVGDLDDKIRRCCEDALIAVGGTPAADDQWVAAHKAQKNDYRRVQTRIMDLRNIRPKARAAPVPHPDDPPAPGSVKIVMSLKPDRLTQNHSMQAFKKWRNDTLQFFTASGLLSQPVSIQRAHLSSCIDERVHRYLAGKLPDTSAPIFEGDDSCMAQLVAMFKTIYPLNTRRLTLFRHSLRPNSSLLDFKNFIQEITDMTGDADIDTGLTRDELIIYLAIKASPDQRTREKLTEIKDITLEKLHERLDELIGSAADCHSFRGDYGGSASASAVSYKKKERGRSRMRGTSGTSANGQKSRRSKSIAQLADEGRCYRCGSNKHRAPACPHRSKKCLKCGTLGHMSNVCQNRRSTSKVRAATSSSTSQQQQEQATQPDPAPDQQATVVSVRNI